ncbi:MAG: hypothetical protein DMG57_07610 [Acidobacteria bacterium]|nr:MAG: hypothetical protein DMG57_07610 [Acidobacteriota bacterium]
MKCAVLICAVLAALPAARPQTSATQSLTSSTALLPDRDAFALLQRITQLMESTAVAMPGMVRAAAPLMENVKQALVNIQAASPKDARQVYILLANARAYLGLSDALPKPYPFTETALKQLAELRDDVTRMDTDFEALLDYKELRVRNPDRDELKRYSEENERLGPATPGNPRVVFLGDSITDGWRLNEYFPGRDFVNRGISGQITGEMLGRMRADVVNLRPAAMLVLAGTNDIARGVPIGTIENNLVMIADIAEFNHVRPLFASVLPVSDYHKNMNPRYEMTRQRPPSTIVTLNRWLHQFCSQRGYTYVDYYSATVDSAGFLQADLGDDGLHPNSKGYRAMASIALEAVNRAGPQQPQKKKRKLF